MKRVAVVFCLAGCIDFDTAKANYCASEASQNRAGFCVVSGRGDGDTLRPEPATPGSIQWGRRCGGEGDQQVRGLAAAPNGELWVAGFFSGNADLCAGPLTAAGGTDLFLARFSPTGEPLQLLAGTGPLDEEATSVAAASDGVYVAGNFTAGLTFGGQGPFDAGTPGRAGFIARVNSPSVDGWVQLSAVESNITRIAVVETTGRRVVALGSFRGQLSVNGRQIDTPRVSTTAFVLVFDGALALRAWALSSRLCNSAFADDLAWSAFESRLHVFTRLNAAAGGCGFGASAGAGPITPETAVELAFPIDGLDELTPSTAAINPLAVVPRFPFLGTVSGSVSVSAYTKGQESDSVATFNVKSVQSDVPGLSRADAVTSSATRAYGAFVYSYTGEDEVAFGARRLGKRNGLSPLFADADPAMSKVGWVRPFLSAGAVATRGLVTVGEDSLIAAGDFSGLLSGGGEALIAKGRSDLFLLSLRR